MPISSFPQLRMYRPRSFSKTTEKKKAQYNHTMAVKKQDQKEDQIWDDPSLRL